jgi:DNA-binding transcriptional ArsR family regulator
MVVENVSETETDRLFQALADATRRDIMRRVIQGEQSVSALASGYAMSFAAVQKHVAVLERAALVVKERRGREQLVHGNPDGLARARRLLDHFEELWRHRTAGIENILAED